MPWLNPQSYALPVLLSLLFHALVAGLLIVRWSGEPKPLEIVPEHVTAEIIQVENSGAKERRIKAEKQRKQQEQEKKRVAEQKKQQELTEKLAQQEAEKQATQQKQKLLKEQQQAKEQAAKEAKQKAQREAQEKSLQEQLMQEQLSADLKAQQQAKKQAELAASVTASFTDKIRAQVQSMWTYPSVVKPNQEVTVRIHLVPTGEVVNVELAKSSGNPALDRSVEQAIYKASPLPVPEDIRIFEQNFRKITMKFRPENATW